MYENNLLTIEQSGFRRGHSTELAEIQLVDRVIKQIDLGNVPINHRPNALATIISKLL